MPDCDKFQGSFFMSVYDYMTGGKQKSNKTGTSQVGAISKAQKYSRNNYWKHLEKIDFFSNKTIFLKKVAQCRKTQKEAT